MSTSAWRLCPMRRLLVPLGVALLVVVACAHGPFVGDSATAVSTETQPCDAGVCSRSTVPTTTAEGMVLSNVAGYRVSVCAASGQTLVGAGTLLAYWCDSVSALCMRNPDLDTTVSASSVRCQVFGDVPVREVSGASDSVVYSASGVTVTDGGSVTVRIYPSIRR